MRPLTRISNEWEPCTPPDLLAWMAEHEGDNDALVIQDEPEKVYYCGGEELLAVCRASGRKVGTFRDLAALLPWDGDPTHPNYCTEGREVKGWMGWAICGGRGECGGKRKFCGRDDGLQSM